MQPATATPRASDAPRQGLGTFFRNILDFIYERGHKAEVLERVSPRTRQLCDKPPGWFSWVPSVHIDELEAAFLTVAGRDMTVELGRVCSQNLGTTVVRPVLRIAFLLAGLESVRLSLWHVGLEDLSRS